MEYFKSSLKSVLGTAPAGTQPTGADTVSEKKTLILDNIFSIHERLFLTYR